MTQHNFKQVSRLAVGVAAGLLLQACGSSSDNPLSLLGANSNSSTGQTNLPSTSWQKGVYQGVDPFYGVCNAPDITREQRQGLLLHENHFVRELMDEFYLWREDSIDVNPNTFADPIQAFYALRSSEVTESGKPKDEFSGLMWYSDYVKRFEQGLEVSTGAYFSAGNFSEQDDGRSLSIVVSYVETDSPAAQAGLKRGDVITAVNNQSVSEVTQFAAKQELFFGLAYPSEGASFELDVSVLGGGVSNLTLATSDVTVTPVLQSQVIAHGTDNVGYLVFNTFSSDLVVPQLQEAFQGFSSAGVSALILDLRYNGGGSIEHTQRLAYMIAGKENTAEKTFSRTQWNDKHPNFDPVTGGPLLDEEFITTEPDGVTQLASLNLSRVTVLTTADSCSASELVMNSLRGIDIEVVQVGGTTCGKPYGFYGIPNCELVYFPVQFQTINAKGFGDYADGFSAASGATLSNTLLPGCEAEDDFTHALGDEQERLLATALYYREHGQCPSEEQGSNKVSFPDIKSPDGIDYGLYRPAWQTIAIKGSL